MYRRTHELKQSQHIGMICIAVNVPELPGHQLMKLCTSTANNRHRTINLNHEPVPAARTTPSSTS